MGGLRLVFICNIIKRENLIKICKNKPLTLCLQESPRLVIPYVSDFPKFPTNRTISGETPTRPHSGMITSPAKQMVPVSAALENTAKRDGKLPASYFQYFPLLYQDFPGPSELFPQHLTFIINIFLLSSLTLTKHNFRTFTLLHWSTILTPTRCGPLLVIWPLL